jgi:hypothetical protein
VIDGDLSDEGLNEITRGVDHHFGGQASRADIYISPL